MTPPFPLSPAPAWFTYVRWKDADTNRNGVFEAGDTVTIKLNASGADAYEVRDYFGTVVDLGAVSGTTLNLGSAWDPGWYRIYFTGASSDGVFGDAYAATNFCVIRPNANFKPLPAGNVSANDIDSVGLDPILRGSLGIAPGRITIASLAEPALSGNNYVTPSGGSVLDQIRLLVGDIDDWWIDSGYEDPLRTRYSWLAFSGRTVDYVALPVTEGADGLRCYLINDLRDGDDVYVTLSAGSVSGGKVTVSYPNAGTVVETFDNLSDPAAAVTAINGTSIYIRVGHYNNGSWLTQAATAIGSSYRTSLVGSVSYLYGLGVTYFEGPSNEPPLAPINAGHDTAEQMRVFQRGVHAGNVNAVAIGPCPVAIDWSGWYYFLSAGGGDYCDEFSFHDYNSMTNANLALGRRSLDRFTQVVESFGYGSKTKWQTEANTGFCSVYGVYHPRRARLYLLHTLLWEQYGVPRERNGPWYDTSHGFWDFPAWQIMEDGSLNPQCVLLRVLAEETWGQTHSHALEFGPIGDKFVLGSVYRGEDGTQTVVLMSTSHMDDATVTLGVVGASSLTMVDGFGNTGTATVTAGLVEIPIDDIPTYVRLPVGANATVYQVNDWGPAPPPSISSKASDMTVGSTFTSVPVDDTCNVDYSNGYGIYYSSAALPENATLLWPSLVDVDRVIVVCGQVWQSAATLVEFDVQTTTDGSSFTTRQTVAKTTPSSFLFGTDSKNAGCSRETYWDEQWVFDLPLGSTYNCTGIRVVATTASYGGEPDSAAVAAGGQGDSTPHLVLQEIFVPSASLPDADATVTPKTAGFELGSNGATISTGDTGNLTVWNETSGSIVYDNSEAGRGLQSMFTASGGNRYAGWTLANLTDHYGRFLLRLPFPTGEQNWLVEVLDNSSISALNIRFTSNRQIGIADSVGAFNYSANVLDGRLWYRIEYHVVHSTTAGQVTLRLYDDATNELIETLITPSTLNTRANGAKVRFGATTGAFVTGYWFDSISAGTDGWLGAIPADAGEVTELVGMVAI